MSDILQPVSLNILGKEYKIKCTDKAKDELISSAIQLDNRMREIRLTGKITNDERIAVIAALNLMHELLETKNNAPKGVDINSKLKNMDSKIESILKNA